MAPSSWMTEPQRVFLKERLPEYLTHTQDKDYFHFWPLFFSAWFAQFPERSVVFPDVEGSLTGEQEALLSKAVEIRKTVTAIFSNCRLGSAGEPITHGRVASKKRPSLYSSRPLKARRVVFSASQNSTMICTMRNESNHSLMRIDRKVDSIRRARFSVLLGPMQNAS
ncbi:hypothetical protein JVT61DRAFT_6930 [Boletus reticuloceps]|uniref:Uncharacterized protein n=1 Tax=Boletus reticuloceps TaxID=495285 RepID=A0A8I2YKI4_9AGAM|nr:hypothetical protein JVT61DRAFT_6930 [Boletus reticuloceps]